MMDDPTETMMRQAVAGRDPGADGRFVYAVLTTGVYCRPSCAARPARPENLRFFADPVAATTAGYRPCKRCQPDAPPRAEREAALVARACRTIEQSDETPTLDQLAQQAGVSPFHFHRLFRRIAGVTPRAYAASRRARQAQTRLQHGESITAALHAAGFGSSGRFYAAAPSILGMTPTAFRAGGAGETIQFALGQSALGRVLVAVAERGICAILLGDDPAELDSDLRRRFPRATIEPAPDDLAAFVGQVVAFVDDPKLGHALPLDIRGTAFQRRVWEALQAVPPGETVSYGELAARLGSPRAVRAVAGACAANPLAVAVPCHRVVGASGALTGYRWGVTRKRALLAVERAGQS